MILASKREEKEMRNRKTMATGKRKRRNDAGNTNNEL